MIISFDFLLCFSKLIQLYPTQTHLRIIPVIFNSLPPTTPAHLSVYQPLPFSDPQQFSNAIPHLLPPFLSTNNSPESNQISDLQCYGGDDPAILEAIIRALELFDRNFNSSHKHSSLSGLPHHKHLLILTATDIGPPTTPPHQPANAPPNLSHDPIPDELPRTVPLFNRKAIYDSVSFQDLAGRYRKDTQGRWNLNDKQPGLLEQKNIIPGLIALNRVPRLSSFFARVSGPWIDAWTPSVHQFLIFGVPSAFRATRLSCYLFSKPFARIRPGAFNPASRLCRSSALARQTADKGDQHEQ